MVKIFGSGSYGKLRAWVTSTLAAHTVIPDAHHSKYTDAEVDTIVAAHAAIVDAHHAKYTDAEVDAIVATHTAIAAAHHSKYTDAEVDTIVTAHTAIASAHHAKYLDAEAVSAMGAKGDGNPLHHDKYTDAEVDAILSVHTAIASAHHAKYLDAEAVAAVATADDYVKNDTSDIMSGMLTVTDLVTIAPYAKVKLLDKPALTNAGDGSVSTASFYTQILSGGVSGNKHYLYSGGQWMGQPWLLNTVLSPATASNNSEMWCVMMDSSLTTPTNTSKHFGFKLLNGDLYATNGDGTNGTATNLNIHLDQYQNRNLTAKIEAAQIVFYVNGTIAATHNTNIPAAGQRRIFVYIKTTENSNKTLQLNNLEIQNR